MTIQLKRGVLLTPSRQRLVAAYETRHAWVDWYTVTWSRTEAEHYQKWREGFTDAMAGRRAPKYRQAFKDAKARLRKHLEAHLQGVPRAPRVLGRILQHNDE